MALKFNCSKCSQEIVVEFLKVGEIVHCRNCGVDSVIPADALSTDEPGTIVRMPGERHQSPQQISKPQFITLRKTLIIGFLTGASIAIVGNILMMSGSVCSPNIIQFIGVLLIGLEMLVLCLLGMGDTLLLYPVVIIVHGMICAVMGYLIVRHKLKRKEEFSIRLFVLKIIGISIIFCIILPILIGLIASPLWMAR